MSSVKLFLLSTCLFLFPAIVYSQTKPEPSDAQDVIKFDTSLVQTDVTVFDKNGRFVDGLRPEQFQLKIAPTQDKRSIYRFSTLVPGGLYQVRVGIRDLKSSRTGSAMDWITVPKI